MAEYTPFSKINYDLFKQNYDPNLPYNQQSQTIQQKYNEDLFNKYSGIASEEPKLGFLDKLTGGLENLFSAYGAEMPQVPNLDYGYNMPTFDLATGITNTSAALPFRSMVDMQEAANQDIVQQIIAENQAENYRRLMTQPGLDKFTGINKGVYDPYGIKVEDGRFSYDMNKTSLADYQPMAMRKDLGFDTSYGVANEDDVEQVESLTEEAPNQGLASLKNLIPGNLFATLLSGILPEESPQMKAAKSFYRDEYGLTPGGSVASGLMAGYNPVSGGLLNMLTQGAAGRPPNVGLQRAYQQRINMIKNTLAKKYADGDYSGTQLDERLAELQRLKTAEQMAMEKPTIDRARETNRDVYREADRQGFTGPGGGFSTTGGRDSGFQSASSKPSGRGRQDY